MHTPQRWTPQNYASRFQSLFSKEEVGKIEEAFIVMREVSHGITRKDKITPEEEHPLHVAEISINDIGFKGAFFIILSLLHDCRETKRKKITSLFISQRFGDDMDRWMGLITKIDNDMIRYCGALMRCQEIVPIAVKLCDVLANLRTLAMCSEDFQKRQILEADEFYLPMARLLIQLLPQKDKHLGYQILRNLEAPIYSYGKEFGLKLKNLNLN